MRPTTRKRTVRARRRLAAALAALAILGLAIGGIAAFADGGSGDPDFELSVSPQTRTVFRGAAVTYNVTITRLNGFDGAVTMSGPQLPAGASGTWTLPDGTTSNVIPPKGTRATFTVQTSSATPLGSQTLTVTATGPSGPNQLVHSADVTLNVRRLFKIAGNLDEPLYPAANLPLNLTLTNSHSFDLQVNDLEVKVGPTHTTGCGASNFSVSQVPPSAYPISLSAGQSKTLEELGLSAADLPRIAMLDTNRNQDACKNIQLRLNYIGSGSR